MTTDLVTIDLQPDFFGSAEAVLARHGRLTASVFRYRGGVAGLRLTNASGHIVMLPLQGQQIWDAEFFGRRLTMQTPLREPVQTEDFLRTYGGFLLHCGATAMGDPSPQDRHPVHGELPNARYQEAQLLIGGDERGPFMTVTGSYRHLVAFGVHYVAQPSVRLREASGRIEMAMSVRNVGHMPMDFMYLAHTNFRPVAGAQLIDTVPSDPQHLRIRSALPASTAASPGYGSLLESLKKDPAHHRRIEPDAVVDPELVLSLSPLADESGWAHGMQLLPNGSADFLSYRPDELNHCLRWTTRTSDMQALGLMLPATAEADGLAAERAKGHVRTLHPQQEFRCQVACGALDSRDADALRATIERVMTQRR